MGDIKNKIRSGIEKGTQRGIEGLETGLRLEKEGREIKYTIDSIDHIEMAEDDIQSHEHMEQGYDYDFKQAYKFHVEAVVEEAKGILRAEHQESSARIDQLERAKEKAGQMERISEVGTKNAETARTRWERSRKEYEQVNRNVEENIKIMEKQLEERKQQMEAIFRKR